MNFLVVGGAGFLGSQLVDRLLSEDHAVDVVDDLSTGSLTNLADARSSGGAVKFHHLDAGSPEADSLIGMRTPEVIFLLMPIPASTAPASAHARCFEIVLSTLDAARRHGVAKVVVAVPASTVYGHPAARALPVKEGDVGQLVPRGVRGVVARAIIDLLVTYRDQYAVEFTALAMTSVYGPRASTGVVHRFAAAAAAAQAPTIDGDGRQTRDLLYVDDAVDALARASTRGGGLVINVGTGIQTPVAELWSRLAALVPGAADLRAVHGPARRDELARFAVSPVRARIHLAWSPWTELDDGLARLVSGA
ncbi:MAG TPA: NAD-dependent epimerase/dehydratase family protein [Ilumatobacteraceae bacterium]|nr:NAD-dependent epimerase/dehydratase family protein [Ilumatobacteraceae bacterium]